MVLYPMGFQILDIFIIADNFFKKVICPELYRFSPQKFPEISKCFQIIIFFMFHIHTEIYKS